MDHELRKTGIGGSDVAALLGISPWKSPLELYCEKLGFTEPVEQTEPMEWGNRLEEVIFKKYIEETWRSATLTSQDFHRHPKHDFIYCHPDGIILAKKDAPLSEQDDELLSIDCGPGVLEIKTANAATRHTWDDGAPDYYMVQLQHNLAVMGAEWGSFAVLFGGVNFLWFDVERSDKIIDVLMQKEQEFWDRVKNENPPPADGSDSSKKALNALYKNDYDTTIALPQAATDLDEARLKAIAEIKKWESVKSQAENHIKELIGENSYGVLPIGGRYSWKTIVRQEHVVKGSTSRILRRLKA